MEEVFNDEPVGDEDELDDPDYSAIRMFRLKKQQMRNQWKFTLIIKVLSRSIGFDYLQKCSTQI